MVEIGGDQKTAGAQKLAQRKMQRRRRRVAVKERDVIAGIERRQHRREFALVHGDAVIEAGRRNILRASSTCSGSRSMVSTVAPGAPCAKDECGVAERRSELEDAARTGRSGQSRQQRTVAVGKGAAVVLRAMCIGGFANVRERIGRRDFDTAAYSRLG